MTTPTLLWPVPGHYEVTSGFDDRRNYGPHNAIDVPAPLGTPYLALAAGRVAFAGRFGSCGITVQVDHANGWRSHVCHLSELVTTTGRFIQARQFIGKVGSTGDSTGPHAHINLFAPEALPGSRFVPWVGKWAVNPLLYLTKEDDMGMTPEERRIFDIIVGQVSQLIEAHQPDSQHEGDLRVIQGQVNQLVALHGDPLHGGPGLQQIADGLKLTPK